MTDFPEVSQTRGAWSELDAREQVVPAEFLQGDVFNDILFPDANRGFAIPFFPAFRLRKAELTCWAGGNGSGKSQLMDQLALSLLMAGEKVCIFSFEMRPQDTLLNMIRMAFGRRLRPDDAPRAEKFFKSLQQSLFVYRNRGAINADFALDAAMSAITERGCGHVFLDNLMMLTSASSSDGLYQAQKKIVEDLKSMADQTGAHVHLVAHLRKNRDSLQEDTLPTRYDISGSADISNLADNVVLINRNFKKEKAALDMGCRTEQWDQKADTVLFLDKQRKSGRMAQQKLWYEKVSGQFCISPERLLSELAPREITGLDLSRPHQMENLWTDEAFAKEYGA